MVFRVLSEPGGPPDIIWHLAANSDIAAGGDDPAIDFVRTLGTTYATLQAAAAIGARAIAFASSSAVYGRARDQVLTEDPGPLLPISNYGAAKLASEALLSAVAGGRRSSASGSSVSPTLVGPRTTHGALRDDFAGSPGLPASPP